MISRQLNRLSKFKITPNNHVHQQSHRSFIPNFPTILFNFAQAKEKMEFKT